MDLNIMDEIMRQNAKEAPNKQIPMKPEAEKLAETKRMAIDAPGITVDPMR